MMVSLLLANRFPLLLWWGPRYIQIYNDPYRPVLGTKHPTSLGQPAAESAEIWNVMGRHRSSVRRRTVNLDGGHRARSQPSWLLRGKPLHDRLQPGARRERTAWHRRSPRQRPRDHGQGHRRSARRGAGRARLAFGRGQTAAEACGIAAETLAFFSRDVPFAMLYLLAPGTQRFSLCGTAGLLRDGPVSPSSVELGGEHDAHVVASALRTVLTSESLQVIDALQARWPLVPPGPWRDPPHTAVAVPIKSNVAHQLAGVLVAGVSPRHVLDAQYKSFFELVAGQIATVVANARAYEAERQRAESLAELDRAKTAFFSNVSHEFRTP